MVLTLRITRRWGWRMRSLPGALLYLPLGGAVTSPLLAYPLVLAAYLAFAFGVGLTVSVVHALFRDLKHLVEVGLPLLFLTMLVTIALVAVIYPL